MLQDLKQLIDEQISGLTSERARKKLDLENKIRTEEETVARELSLLPSLIEKNVRQAILKKNFISYITISENCYLILSDKSMKFKVGNPFERYRTIFSEAGIQLKLIYAPGEFYADLGTYTYDYHAIEAKWNVS